MEMRALIIPDRRRAAAAAPTRPGATLLGILWLLGACGTPDYSPVREWAGTASRTADYPALAATCHVRPGAEAAQQATWLAATRAMQDALSLYLSGLGTMAADGVLPHREDPLVEAARQAAMLDEAGGRAVAELGAVLRRATRRNARAPALGDTIAEADPPLQALVAALSSGVRTIATAAAADRAAVAAALAGDAAAARDPATRRLLLHMASLHDRDFAVRELARARYLAALAGIAEGHALLLARSGNLSQEATARAVRAAEDQLRRIAEQLPQLLGPSLAGVPCGAPAVGNPPGAGA